MLYAISGILAPMATMPAAKAVLDCAEFYLKLENYDCRKQVMEYHLIGME